VLAICRRYVALALQNADFSDVQALAIDETARSKGQDCITLVADVIKRKALAVAEGRDAKAVATMAAELAAHGYPPENIKSEDKMRRIEQRSDKSLKGMRWALLKDRANLQPESCRRPGCTGRQDGHRAYRPRLGLQGATARDPRAQADQRRAGHAGALVHLRHALKVEPMKEVAALVRSHIVKRPRQPRVNRARIIHG
jgi:transposase